MDELDEFSMNFVNNLVEEDSAKALDWSMDHDRIATELAVPTVFLKIHGSLPSLCCDEGLMRGLFRTSVARFGCSVRYGRGHAPQRQEWCMTFDTEEQKFSERLVMAEPGRIQIFEEGGSYDLTVEYGAQLFHVELKALSDTGGKSGNLDFSGMAKDAGRVEEWEHARMFVLCDEALFSKQSKPWPLDKLLLDPP